MNLVKMNIWRGGFFKQLRYLVSTPQKVQRCVFISETGVVSQELLPMETGFVTANAVKKAWAVVHNLKFQVWKGKELAQDDSVLVISERSYIPLDPLNVQKPQDRAKMASLKDIARLRHAEARADSGKNRDIGTQLTQLIINWGFIMLCLFGLITLIKGCD